ncbi:ABC transporter involved in cytochrome c biogenesis, CcmB subunit [hydrothermal vent metagenome]|uniref:Heme exporter protein B n=1 Tax=hydrothermal vent metagenome TaxID=652676 RepID=A0A3B0ZV05_9ZZZZ
MNVFITILKRDLLLAIRHRAELLNPMLFFVLVIVLFQLGMRAKPVVLITLAPAIIWIAALLSALLSLDHMFRSDMEDGALEQMIISTQPTSLLVLAKIIAHWIITGLPITLIAPILGMMLGLTFDAIKILFLTLLIGTPILSAIGSIGVALTVGLRRGGVLLSILVLPLYVPVLIFASQTVTAAMTGYPIVAPISVMMAMMVLSLSLAPWASSAALRMSVS